MVGDPNQCSPVEGGSAVHHDYANSASVKEMCPQRTVTSYREDSARYDAKTHAVLERFLRRGKLPRTFRPTTHLDRNICYLNRTRVRVNKECCEKAAKGNASYSVTFRYGGGLETYPVCVGTPVIATTNL